jgi:hypothetical protein
VAETLLRAITAELLPAMARIARIADAMVAGAPQPQRFDPIRAAVPRLSNEVLNFVPMVARTRSVAPDAMAAIVAHLKTRCGRSGRLQRQRGCRPRPFRVVCNGCAQGHHRAQERQAPERHQAESRPAPLGARLAVHAAVLTAEAPWVVESGEPRW